jgi:hypothetical protein
MALPAVKAIAGPATGIVVAMVVPSATETIAPVVGGALILHLKTTGTTTTVTWTDPGTTPAGSAAMNPTVVMGATDERFIYVQASLASLSTGLITAAFSGAMTGVTGEWLRA